MSYVKTVRRDALDQVSDLRKGNPPKYQMVIDQIVDLIRGATLIEPAGPDEE